MTTTRRSFSEVRPWIWNRHQLDARPGIAVLGWGQNKHRLFISSKAECEKLVEELISVMERPETWEEPT